MPGAHEILLGLTRVANAAQPLAIAWHVALAGALFALARGFRPSQRLSTSLLAAPLVSVAALGFLYHNPFNGVVFSAAALATLALSLRAPATAVERCSPALAVWALLLLEFAWLYPHFLADHFVLVYLYASPLGLLPCPTLAAVAGFALLGRGFGARAWPTLVGLLAVAYGLFGALLLGVAIDLLLALGGFILLGTVWSRRGSGVSRTTQHAVPS